MVYCLRFNLQVLESSTSSWFWSNYFTWRGDFGKKKIVANVWFIVTLYKEKTQWLHLWFKLAHCLQRVQCRYRVAAVLGKSTVTDRAKCVGEMQRAFLWKSFIQGWTGTTPSSVWIWRVSLYSTSWANPIFTKDPDIIYWHLAFLINRSMPSPKFLHWYLLKTKHLKRNVVSWTLIHFSPGSLEAKCILK